MAFLSVSAAVPADMPCHCEYINTACHSRVNSPQALPMMRVLLFSYPASVLLLGTKICQDHCPEHAYVRRQRLCEQVAVSGTMGKGL